MNRVCLTHIGHDSLAGLPGMILTSADVVETIKKEMDNSAKKQHGTNGNNDNGQQRNNSGGLMNDNNRKRNGSLLSNEEEGVPDLEVVGPNGTNAFLHSLRHFMRRDRFKVHAHEGQYDSSLNNNKVSESLNAKKKAKKKNAKKGTPDTLLVGFDVKTIPIAYDDVCDNHPNYDENDLSTQPLPITKHAVSYLFTTPPIPGKFQIDKAKALNVPRGPMYAHLKAGKSVTFTDPNTEEERTVTSEEVVDKSSPGVGVGIVYCPTLNVLSKLKDVDTFGDFGEITEKENSKSEVHVDLDVMVHMTPKTIFSDPVYQSWCMGFGTEVTHVCLHAAETLEDRVSEDENSPFVAGICGALRRSYVNDGLFPMPLPNFLSSQGTSDEKIFEEAISTIKGCMNMDYVLMPRSRRGLDESSNKPLYSTTKIDELRDQVMESGAVEKASSIMSSVGQESDNRGQSECSTGLGELIFTGTGSAVPCKHRNVTGIYLRMNNGNSILLDVGEGTFGQLLRSWKSTLSSNQTSAVEEYRTRLSGIKAVFITHPHADHHLGLLRLLSERAAICGPTDPVVLMAPHDMFDFLHEFRSVAPEINGSYIPVDCYDMIHGKVNPLGKKLFDDLGITNCMSVPVAHCLRSYAVVIDGTSFGKVAYSGDCRPSTRFADVGFGADLLIHEATFENGMEEDAVMKRHSTVGEAMCVASKMNAKSLVLTHFSQRYPKIPSLKKIEGTKKTAEDTIPIAIAFDFMRLTPNTIDLAAQLTPALRLLYPGEGGDEAEMATKSNSAKELMAVPGVFAVQGVL